jgi:hypothetical protein
MSIKMLSAQFIREVLEGETSNGAPPTCSKMRGRAEPCGTLLVPYHNPKGPEVIYVCPACDMPPVEDPLRNPT